MIPSTPRVYLVASTPGSGSTGPTSAAVSCSRSAGGSDKPIGTSSTSPAYCAPGSISRPDLIVPKVMVAAARTASPSTAPVSASTPLGRSTASVRAAGDSRASRAAGGTQPSLATDADHPVQDQIGRCRAVARRFRRPHAGSRRPARRAASAPSSCSLLETVKAVTAAPRPASRAAAKRASPPLSPPPTSTDDPRAVHPAEPTAGGGREPGGRPLHERAVRQLPHQLLLGGANLRNPVCVTHESDLARSDGGQLSRMTTAIAIPPSWLRDTCQLLAPRFLAASAIAAAQFKPGGTAFAVGHRRVMPAQACRGSQRLGQRLLRGEPGSQPLGALTRPARRR